MVNMNGNGANGDDHRLKVIIVRAGICGLTCGAAMREYADVTILEGAPAIGEIGAAVHLAPNAYRIIKSLGGDLLSYGAQPCKSFQEWTAKGNRKVIDSSFDPLAEAGCEWVLCHRADVQEELKRCATTLDGPGKPCTVILGAFVVDCDADSATVTTKDGKTYTGDVLIGADGIKSNIRHVVVGSNFHSRPSGHSAYRALVPASKIETHPELSKLGLFEDRIMMINGNDRRIVTYATRDRKLLNFVCALPDTELNEISEERWSAKGNPEALVKSFSGFDPIWQELLSQIDECGLWQLRDQDPLDNWVKGRAILVGDAAHSMLPHQGQGASQAIEDGEALGAVLRDVTADGVPKALERVFSIRYKRATFAQQISRTSGLGEMREKYLKKLGLKDTVEQVVNPQQYKDFSWNYYGALDWEKNHSEWVAPGEIL